MFNEMFKHFNLLCRCPVDYEILGPFEYSKSKTTAVVRFQAHKFPYTDSVYYQCNVRLCIKNAGGCDAVVSCKVVLMCTSQIIILFIKVSVLN